MTDKVSNESPGGLPGVIRQGITNYMKDVHTALPGKIVSFDIALQTAKVQLLIRRIFKGGNELDLPQLINVPVWQPRAGGYCITFPIKPDDECLVLFSERSLDKWFKFGDVQTPTDFRMHSLSDAICLVGMSSEPKVIREYDGENFQVRNEEKDQTITMLPNKDINVTTGTVIVEMLNESETINLTAPTKINIDTPLAEYTTDVKINGKLEVIQDVTMGANLDVSGQSTAADHISGTVSGKTHLHVGSPTSPIGPVTPTGVPI